MDVGLLQNVEVGGSGFKDLRRLPVHTVSILPCVDDRPQAISVVEGVVVKTGLVFLDVFLFANVEYCNAQLSLLRRVKEEENVTATSQRCYSTLHFLDEGLYTRMVGGGAMLTRLKNSHGGH